MYGLSASIRHDDSFSVKTGDFGLMVHVKTEVGTSDFLFMPTDKARELATALSAALPVIEAPSQHSTLDACRWLLGQLESGGIVCRADATEAQQREFLRGLAAADAAVKEAEGKG